MSHRQRFAQRQAMAKATSHFYTQIGTNATVSSSRRQDKTFVYSAENAALASLSNCGRAPLKCPGGPRMRGVGLRELFGVTSNGPLAKYDQRFILNLRLTHELMAYFDVCNAGDEKLFFELGPGVGALTRSLLTGSNVHGVVAVEADRRYAPILDALSDADDLQYNQNDDAEAGDQNIYRQSVGEKKSRFTWIRGDLVKQDELALLEQVRPMFIRERCRQMTQLAYATSPANLRKVRQSERCHQKKSLRGNTRSVPPNVNAAEEEELDDFFASLDKDGNLGGKSGQQQAQTENLLLPADGFASKTSLLDEEGVTPGVVDLCWSNLRPSVEVIGNLPFCLTLPLCIRYAIDASRKQNLFRLGRVPIHLFCQQAVAERLVAVPGTKQYGLPSVIMQNYFKITLRRTFKEKTFFPATEVLGALVTLEPRVRPLVGGSGIINRMDGSPDPSHSSANNAEDDFLDGATLLQFTKYILSPRQRSNNIGKALRRVVPAEVGAFILAECRISPSIPTLNLNVKEISLLAVYWYRYLEASNQMRPMSEYMDEEENAGDAEEARGG